jgi:hypothetical protein
VTKISTVFRRARKLVAAGWAQDTMTSTHNSGDYVCYCAAGAIAQAASGQFFETARELAAAGETKKAALLDAALRMFRKVIGGRQIFAWNDSKTRTQEQVVAAMGRAIMRAEAAGV